MKATRKEWADDIIKAAVKSSPDHAQLEESFRMLQWVLRQTEEFLEYVGPEMEVLVYEMEDVMAVLDGVREFAEAAETQFPAFKELEIAAVY